MIEKIKTANKKLKRIMKNNHNYSMVLFALLVISGYIFFFSSKELFGENKILKFSDMNTIVKSEETNREITLTKWVYCPQTLTMEVELSIINKNYDGNDSYDYTVIDRKGKNYECNVIISAPTIQVIQIYNVDPKNFKELRLEMNMNSKKELAKYYTNQNQVEVVDEIIIYDSLNDYYIAKLDRYIRQYEDEIEGVKGQIEEQNQTYNNYNDLLNNLVLQKNYAAGDELDGLNKQIADTNKLMISTTSTINDLKNIIKDKEKKIEDYKAIKEAYLYPGE